MFRDHKCNVLGWQGPPEVPALAKRTAQPQHSLSLFARLDSLGNGPQPKALAEPYHSGHDFSAFAPFGHRGDKTAVYFQLVEGQRLEMEQAGIALSKIVLR